MTEWNSKTRLQNIFERASAISLLNRQMTLPLRKPLAAVRVAPKWGEPYHWLGAVFERHHALLGDEELVPAYLKHYETKDDASFWAWQRLQNYISTAPRKAWEVTLQLIAAANESELGYVAAGPLEDLLYSRAEYFIDDVERLARIDTKFLSVLRMINGPFTQESDAQPVSGVADAKDCFSRREPGLGSPPLTKQLVAGLVASEFFACSSRNTSAADLARFARLQSRVLFVPRPSFAPELRESIVQLLQQFVAKTIPSFSPQKSTELPEFSV